MPDSAGYCSRQPDKILVPMLTYLQKKVWRDSNAVFARLRTRCEAEEACKLKRMVED
jgi:hypothetical protein